MATAHHRTFSFDFQAVAEQLKARAPQHVAPAPRPPNRERVDELILLCRAVMFPSYSAIPQWCLSTGSFELQDPESFHTPTVPEITIMLHVLAERLTVETVAAVELSHWDSLLHPLDGDNSNQCARHGDVYDGRCISITRGATSWDHEALTLEARRQIVQPFIDSLPTIADLLTTDLEVVVKKDVVVNHRSEVLLNYPGLLCLTYQRVAHRLHRLGAPMLLTRMITEIAHSKTGIDIHPATTIGHSCFIDHGTGIVVGATAEIGNGVSLYQGVSLGAKSFKENEKGERIKHLPRHPIVEDDVTLYSHACALGRIRLGKGATIGGNVWVVKDVKPGELLVQGRAEKCSETYFFGEGI